MYKIHVPCTKTTTLLPKLKHGRNFEGIHLHLGTVDKESRNALKESTRCSNLNCMA